MNLPKYHETFMPVLKVLEDGRTIHRSNLIDQVIEKFYKNLPPDLLNIKTKSGDALIRNRISWGIVYLKQAQMIQQPSRGIVQITEKGAKAIRSDHLSYKDVINDSDFLSHRKIKKDGLPSTHSSETPDDLIESGFFSIETKLKSDLLNKLKSINPYLLEKVVLELFEKMGYGEVFVTAKSGDGGIDGIINQDQLGIEKIYVQVKRYKDNKIREGEIRNFIGAMSRDTQKGIFVTTSSFDQSAETKAHEAQHKIILIDGEKLVELMLKFNIGVQVKNVYETKEIDEDFFDEE